MLDYFQQSSDELIDATIEHLFLVLKSLGIALILASILIVLILKNPRLKTISVYSQSILRALAANPDVVLFDEPFGAIDAITRSSLQEELRNIHRQLGDKTFIFITHDIYEAFRLGDRVLIMDQGKICQFDSPEQIIQSPQGAFVANLIETVKEQEKIWRTYA